jgi:hypothetical protein
MWTEVYLVELLETPHRASRPMGEDVVAIAGEPHAGYMTALMTALRSAD